MATSLTRSAGVELRSLASWLRDVQPPTSALISSPAKQCLDSSALIGSFLGMPYREDSRLRSFNMGALDGLSSAEAAKVCPEYFKRLEAWRNGNFPVREIETPGSDDVDAFVEMNVSFLQDLNTLAPTIVGTRSTLTALANIVLDDLVAYPYRNFPNSSVTMLMRHKETFTIERQAAFSQEGFS